MAGFAIQILRAPTTREHLASEAALGFGDMVKAVVDVERKVIAIGGELHSDEEAALLDDGSRQQHLWGINLFPRESSDTWLEFDSMINVRPAQGNRTRGVDDGAIREAIRRVIDLLVTSA